MTDTTTPPDQTVWWDADAVTVAARDVLRLSAADVDADRIAALVPVAGAAINDHLDRPDDNPITLPAPPALTNAIVEVVVELYRRKDAPPTSADGLLAATWRPAAYDTVAGVAPLIRPYKRRFGVG